MEREITGQSNVANPFDTGSIYDRKWIKRFQQQVVVLAKQAGVDQAHHQNQDQTHKGCKV